MSDFFNEISQVIGDRNIFIFPGLRSTPEADQSKMILRMPNPKIIIAGSGMSSGGRIVHHEHNIRFQVLLILLFT